MHDDGIRDEQAFGRRLADIGAVLWADGRDAAAGPVGGPSATDADACVLDDWLPIAGGTVIVGDVSVVGSQLRGAYILRRLA